MKFDKKACCYSIWLFVCHVYALGWKHFMLKRRRLPNTLFEILAPSLMMLVLVYGVSLSPTVPIPGFVYDEVPTFPVNATQNLPTKPMDNATKELLQLLEAAHLYNSNNPTSYFETVFLPELSKSNSSLSQQLSNLVLANTAAAAPFLVPSFDSYIALMERSRIQLGRQGRKMLQHLSPLLWHIMHLGKVAVIPSNDFTSDFVSYMSNTTSTFQDHLLGGDFTRGIFDTEGEAQNYAKTWDKTIWAILDFSNVDLDTGSMAYTIRINSTLVPDTNTIVDLFPQGLGAKYAEYIYSGFSPLQFEVNEFIARKVRTSPDPMEFGVLPLFLSTCGPLIDRPLMYPQPTDITQILLLQQIISAPPKPIITKVPVPQPSWVFPCMYELYANCTYGGVADPVACLQNMAAAGNTSKVCKAAIDFSSACAGVMYNGCENMTLSEFLTSDDRLGPTQCLSRSMIAQCEPNAEYRDFIKNSSGLYEPCQKVGASYCNGGSPEEKLECLQRHAQAGTLCRDLIDSLPSCQDDIQTVCSYNSPNSFNPLCLHYQRDVLSQTCLDSPIMADMDRLAAYNASVSIPTTQQYICREASSVSKAFDRGVAVGAFPAQAYDQSQFFANSQLLVGLVVALSYMYPFVATVRVIVQERERKQRLLLLCLGVRHWTMTFTYLVLGIILSFLTAIPGTITVQWVLPNVPFMTVFTLLFWYGFSLVCLALLLGSMFDSSRNASAVAPFVIFLFAVPAFVAITDLEGLMWVMSPSVLVVSFVYVVAFSQSAAPVGILASKLAQSDGVLFALGLLYLILALLIEQYRVSSSTKGIIGSCAMSFDRLLGRASRTITKPVRNTRAYTAASGRDYTGTQRAFQEDSNSSNQEMASIQHLQGSPRSAANADVPYENMDENVYVAAPGASTGGAAGSGVESAADVHIGGVGSGREAEAAAASRARVESRVSGGRAVLQPPIAAFRVFAELIDISWSYIRGSKETYAVRDVNAVLYDNRTNCIVAPSGSGKSTLLSMLVGALPPMRGHVLIENEDPVKFDRQSLGICFQEDVFWDCLSIREHIELVQLLKGNIDHNVAESESKTLLAALQLVDRRNAWANALSKGCRRRLSTAMAFAGGSRFVVLDEPTASVDPLGRRAVWELIKQNQKGRCIVVTTNFIEEAEAADHVMVLAKSRIKVSGTPAFLRQTLGLGPLVTVAREAGAPADPIRDLVYATCPAAALVNSVGGELAFRIDPDGAQNAAEMSSAAAEVIEALEAQASDLKLISTIVKDAPLEEIFLRVAREVEAERGSTQHTLNGGHQRRTSGQGDGELVQEADQQEQGAADGGYAQMAPNERTGVSSQGVSVAGGADSPVDVDVAEDAAFGDLAALSRTGVIGTEREEAMRHHGFRLFIRQVWGTIMRRFVGAFAHKETILMDMFLPIFAVIFAMGLLKVRIPDPQPLNLSPTMYGGDQSVFFTDASVNRSFDNMPSLTSSAPGVDHWLNPNPGWWSAANVSTLLQGQQTHHHDRRYGAFAFNDTFAQFVNYYWGVSPLSNPVAAYLNGSQTSWYVDTVLHNTSSPHALPTFLNVLGTIRMRRAAGTAATASGYIQVTSFPLKAIGKSFDPSRAVLDLVGSILLLLPFAFLPANYIAHVVRERETGILAAMMASRYSVAAYWLGNFAWNVGCFVFIALQIVLLFSVFHQELIKTMSDVWLVLGMIWLYGMAATSLSYIFSKMFVRHTTAQNAVGMLHLTFGLSLVVAAFSVDLLPDNDSTTEAKQKNESWMKLFRLWPSYAMGEAFVRLASLPVYRFMGQPKDAQAVIGPSLHLMWLFPLYLTGLICYERYIKHTKLVRGYKEFSLGRKITQWWVARGRSREELDGGGGGGEPWEDESRGMMITEDEDGVRDARDEGPTVEGLSVLSLWKRYRGKSSESGSTMAVSDVSINVRLGSRLAIIGVNGSGKSTLQRCATGDLVASHGDSQANRYTLQGSQHYAARTLTGISPELGGVELAHSPYYALHVMADCRGLRMDDHREAHVMFLLQVLGLFNIRHVTMEYLPEAARRRVSVAMALVGFPPILFLDEPTSRLDPLARRRFWAAIAAAPSRTATFMTTQSIEETAALGSRVLALDGGRMRFVGNLDDVKTRLGGGYTLTITMSTNLPAALASQYRAEVLEFALGLAPGSQVVERSLNGDSVTLRLRDESRQQMSLAAPEATLELGPIVRQLSSKQQELSHALEKALQETPDAEVGVNTSFAGPAAPLQVFHFTVGTVGAERLLLDAKYVRGELRLDRLTDCSIPVRRPQEE